MLKLALALSLLASVAAPQTVFEIEPEDVVISHGSAPPGTVQVTYAQDVAYNPKAHEYLVVSSGKAELAGPGWSGFLIFGRRIDAATGLSIDAEPFPISDQASPVTWESYPNYASVAYDPDDDQYLVVWRSFAG